MKTPEEQAEEYAYFIYDEFPDMRYEPRENCIQDWLAGYAAAREWHPIETAPKDGTEISILFEGINTPIPCLWGNCKEIMGDLPGLPDGSAIQRGWCSFVIDLLSDEPKPIPEWLTPTHWQSLPEPPKE
jgi:hypothetical protein